jgi:hypothetical protein
MPESKDRDALLKKIQQAETAANINSAGLQPPK